MKKRRLDKLLQVSKSFDDEQDAKNKPTGLTYAMLGRMSPKEQAQIPAQILDKLTGGAK
jgi:hypothetical protein